MKLDVDPAVEAAVAALRVVFVRELPPKLDEVGAAIALARGGDPAALRGAYQLAHRLFGSTGAYGLADVAEPLGTIEKLLYDATEQRAAPDEQLWRAIDASLAAANEAAARRRSPLGE